jgi:hypothetical protein
VIEFDMPPIEDIAKVGTLLRCVRINSVTISVAKRRTYRTCGIGFDPLDVAPFIMPPLGVASAAAGETRMASPRAN